MKTMFVAAAMACTLSATPLLALTSKKTVVIAATPNAVWKKIGAFCGIADWHPAIEKCVLANRTERVLTLRGGGGTIRENQISRSETGMHYSYAILGGPLPVAKYTSTIAVAKKGSGSEVTWSGQYDAAGATADKAQAAIDGVYSSGLKGLAGKFRK